MKIYKLSYLALSLALAVCFLLTTEPRAYAYVDPGSSLLLFQGVGAAVSAVLFYCRRRLRLLFGRFGGTRLSERKGQ